MRRSIIAGLLLTAVAAGAVHAAEGKPEDLLKARQGMLQAVKLQFLPLVAVAKGDAKLSDDTAERAANLAALAKVLPTTFAKGTENLPHSDAKAEAFTRPEFGQGFQHLAEEAAKIEAAAKANDLDGVKAAVASTQKVCKSCHEVFKAD